MYTQCRPHLGYDAVGASGAGRVRLQPMFRIEPPKRADEASSSNAVRKGDAMVAESSRTRTVSPGLCLAVAIRIPLGLALALLPVLARAQGERPTPSPSPAAEQSAAGPTGFKKLSLAELMDIEVTSVSKRPEKLSETPSAIQAVSNEDLRRSGASSLAEGLRLASNLQVAQRNSHDWAISARGFNTELGNKLLILIDGRTVYTPLFSGVFWNVQDTLLEDVDRIEVISGPGGTLWGANAVNGVINITTRSARDTEGGFIEAGGGNWQRAFVSGRYGASLGSSASVRGYGKYFERDVQSLSDGKDAQDSWHMGQGGFRLDGERPSGSRFTLQGDLYRGGQEIPGAGGGRTSGANVIGRWTRTLSDRSDFSLQGFFDRTHLRLPTAATNLRPAGFLVDDLETYDLDFQHRFRAGDGHRLVWGAGYRFTRDEVQNAPTIVFLPPNLDHHLFSGFIQDEIRLSEKLFATVGTKLEHNDYTGAEVEPSARLQWLASSRQVVWAAVSRAVRTPSRIDRDLRQPTGLPAPFPASILNGNEAFRSETVVAWEAGYRLQVASRFIASAALFYNDYDDLRSTTPGPPGFPSLGFPLVFWNNLEGEAWGAELSASFQPSSIWRLRAGYNLLQEDLRVKKGQVDFSQGLNETADPKHQFSLQSSLDVTHKTSLDLGLRSVSALHNNNGPNPGVVPSYVELDARLAVRITPHASLSLVGQNLLHDRHPEYGFPSPSRIEIRRSAYCAMTLRW
jgi:iron complex outermembrane receptor protein